MSEKLLGSIAVALAAFFAGGATYITVVEQPARLLLDDRGLLIQWQHSYPLGLRMQSTLAIAAGFAGIVTWWMSRNWRWMLGTALILLNWPYTLIMLLPVNNELMAIAPDSAGGGMRALMERWGSLHAVRSGLGILAMVTFLWALNRRTVRSFDSGRNGDEARPARRA